MTDDDTEYNKFNREMAVRAHDRSDELAKNLNRAAIDSATLVLRSLVLVNGAAVIAVMAFLANVISKSGDRDLDNVFHALSLFAFGVFFALLAAVFGYFANYFYGSRFYAVKKQWEHPYCEDTNESKDWKAVAFIVHMLSALAAIVSVVLFLYGVMSLKEAMIAAF